MIQWHKINISRTVNYLLVAMLLNSNTIKAIKAHAFYIRMLFSMFYHMKAQTEFKQAAVS